jgi:hypothetical protein
MDNAENSLFQLRCLGEVDALGSCVKPFLSWPYINDAAEYMSVEALPGDQLKQQYHYGYVARSPLILWYWYFWWRRIPVFGLVHKYPPFIDVAESRRAGSNEKLRRARGQGLPTSARHETQ